MKNLTVSPPLTSGTAASRFNAARAMAITLAEADSEILEPELTAWIDRSTSMASPVGEGCSWPEAWHDYGVSHEGRATILRLSSPSPAPSIHTSVSATAPSLTSAMQKETR